MHRTALVSLVVLGSLAFGAACVGEDPNVVTVSGPDGGSDTKDGAPGPITGTPSDAASVDAADGGDGGSEAGPPCTPPATAAVVVFLNKNGGTYTAGPDDSRINQTALASSSTGINPWTVSAGSWSSLVACVAQKFAPFHVTVTDVDPGNSPHIEVVFAQSTAGVLSGASANAFTPCSYAPNAVSFVSTAYADANIQDGCAAAAANVGFALGLEYVASCNDAMSFTPSSCPTVGFSSTAAPCGTTAPAACTCQSGTTQASFTKILAITGPACQ